MPDYSKGKIYQIINNVTDKVYVGSTTNTLSQRMAMHRYDCKRGKQFTLYDHVKELGGWEEAGFRILLIEDYPCERKEQLNRREGEIIQEMGTLNKNIAGRTRQEYYRTPERLEKKREYMRERRQNPENREYMREYCRQWRQNPDVREKQREKDRERDRKRRAKKKAEQSLSLQPVGQIP